MKNLNPKALEYIAKTYGRKYAGDESNPSQSEVTDQILSNEESKLDQTPSNIGQAEELAQAKNPDVQPTFPEATPVQAPADQGQPAPPSDYEKAGVPDIEGALEEQKAANTAAAEATAKQGEAEVKAYTAANAAFAALPTQNDIAAGYKAKDDALFKAYQAKELDPNRYYHNMGTAQKVITGIGLLLGGVNSSKLVEDAVNRDIDAQKNSQDQQMNLWKMNKEEYGNDLAANLATQNQIFTGVKAQLEQAASAAKGPMAKAAAQNGNALIDQKIAENRFKLSLMQPTSDTIGLDPAKKVTWLVPSEKQVKVNDEIEAAQNATRAAPEVMSNFDQAAKEVRPLTGGLSTSLTAFVPGMESAGQKSLHTLLGPTFKDVEGTVRQAAMDNIFKNTTPQFGDDDSTIASKRRSLQYYLMSKSSASNASSFGINLGDYPSTAVKHAFPPTPGSKAAKPGSSEVRYLNGKPVTKEEYLKMKQGQK